MFEQKRHLQQVTYVVSLRPWGACWSAPQWSTLVARHSIVTDLSHSASRLLSDSHRFVFRQACPIAAWGNKGKGPIRDGIEFAQKSVTKRTTTDDTEDPIRVIFCVSCFRRNPQLLAAMAINCALWWSMRQYWRLAICTFGEDVQTVKEIQTYFRVFIECGLLVIGSGGTMGNDLTSTDSCWKPKWMPKLPTGTPPHQEDGKLGLPSLKYWHASTAKNAAHQLGNHCWGDNACWVNLDCDQIVPLIYVRSVVEEYRKNRDVLGLCIECVDVAGSLTGRLACRGKDYLAIGGYDEFDTPPSGGQDVDLKLRLNQLALTAPHAKKWAGIIQLRGANLCGFALPNDFADTRTMWDRGQSKTVNVNPLVWTTFNITRGEQEWEDLKTKGWNIFKERLDRKEYIRNKNLLLRQFSIGAWFCVVAWEPNQNDKNLTAGDPPMAENVIVSPDWNDEPVSPVHIPDERRSPRAVEMHERCPITVDLAALGARELMFSARNQKTSLGPMHVHVC